LYGDNSQGYQRAVSIYQMVDSASGKLGAAALAHMAGERIGLLSFLSKLTPKEDNAQALDLGLKCIAEMVAFCQANGFPGDGIGDFMGAVSSYEKENLIRMAGIVVFDGLIPLGPNFADKMMESIQGAGSGGLENNAIFQRVKGLIPGGGSSDDSIGFITNGVGAMKGYLDGFASTRGVTLDGVLGSLRGVIDFSEAKLDYLAAFLDISTNYMEHTGIQSVSRSLIERAVGEI
jgi:hypothetical protein